MDQTRKKQHTNFTVFIIFQSKELKGELICFFIFQFNKHNTRHEVLTEAANKKPKGTNISQVRKN